MTTPQDKRKHLLDRPPEANYLAEWTELLAIRKENGGDQEEIPVLIFRLGKNWLALVVHVCAEVAEERSIHQVPHRRGVLLGIVNLRGQMTLCVDLHKLLEIEVYTEDPTSKQVYRRLLAIQQDHDSWIFPVDEVYGVHPCAVSQLENVPVTLERSKDHSFKGVFKWNGRSVGLIDEELLFSILKRSLP